MSQIKKGAALSYLNILLVNIIGLILTPFIIKSLGNSEYGLYALIGSFVAYLTLMDLGLNNTIVRFVARFRTLNDFTGERKFLGTVMTIYFFISLVLIIIGILLYLNLEGIFSRSLTQNQIKDAKIMFLILIFNLALTIPGGSFTAICNAYEYFIFPRLVASIKYVLRAFTVVIILTLGGKAIALVIIDTVFNIFVVIATSIFVFKRLKVRFNFGERDRKVIRNIFSYSIWIFLLAISSKFLWNAGQLVLGIETNTEIVAIFAVAIMLGGFYGSFSTAISSVFLPRATQMSIHNSKEEILEMMIKIGRISFMVLMFALTGFISLGKEFIYLWLGEDYYQSWIIALIMMSVYTIPLIQNFAHSLIEAYNKVAIKVKVYLTCFSIGLILGYLLIENYQAVGMMSGLSIGWLVAQIIMNYFYHEHLKLNIYIFIKRVFHRIFFPVILLCLVLSLTNYLLPQGWWVFIMKIGIYSVIYWAVLYLYSMNDFEKQLIKSKIIRR